MVRRSRRGRASLNWLMGFQNRGPYSLQNLMSRRGAARANLQWRNRSMTRTQTRTRSRPGSGVGVTTQHDARFIYGKRRMPRGKRMRWKRFGNKVHAVAERDLGSRTVLRNQMELFANNTPGNHITGSYTLYGQRGTAGRHDDLQQIASLENAGDPTAAAGVTVDPSTKFIFKSAVMDLTFKNDASYRGAVDPLILTPSGDLKIELDIYEISVRTGSEETGLTAANLETLFNQNNTITKSIGGGGTEIDYFTRGSTPGILRTYSDVGVFGFGRKRSISWRIKMLLHIKFEILAGALLLSVIWPRKTDLIALVGLAASFLLPRQCPVLGLSGRLRIMCRND